MGGAKVALIRTSVTLLMCLLTIDRLTFVRTSESQRAADVRSSKTAPYTESAESLVC